MVYQVATDDSSGISDKLFFFFGYYLIFFCIFIRCFFILHTIISYIFNIKYQTMSKIKLSKQQTFTENPFIEKAIEEISEKHQKKLSLVKG